MREHIFLNQASVTVEDHTQVRNSLNNRERKKGYKKPLFNPWNSNNKRNERNSCKSNTCFRCGLDDHFVANFPKPDTLDMKVHWNMENSKTCAYRLNKIDKTLENSADKRESPNIYASMARIYYNVEIPRINYGDILQLTNFICATCHIAPDI